jgi:hypothetical protein
MPAPRIPVTVFGETLLAEKGPTYDAICTYTGCDTIDPKVPTGLFATLCYKPGTTVDTDVRGLAKLASNKGTYFPQEYKHRHGDGNHQDRDDLRTREYKRGTSVVINREGKVQFMINTPADMTFKGNNTWTATFTRGTGKYGLKEAKTDMETQKIEVEEIKLAGLPFGVMYVWGQEESVLDKGLEELDVSTLAGTIQ